MQYDLTIRDHNIPAHLDIEKEIEKLGSGLFTFTLRVNGGNIVDFMTVELVDVQKKYLGGLTVAVEKHTTTYSY